MALEVIVWDTLWVVPRTVVLNGPPIVDVRILLEWVMTVRFEGPCVTS